MGSLSAELWWRRLLLGPCHLKMNIFMPARYPAVSNSVDTNKFKDSYSYHDLTILDKVYEPKPGPGGGTETGMALLLLFILTVLLRQSNTPHPLRCKCFMKSLMIPPLDATAVWQIKHIEPKSHSFSWNEPTPQSTLVWQLSCSLGKEALRQHPHLKTAAVC